MADGNTSSPVEQVNSKSSYNRNPEGKGGFRDHPELINRNGPPRKQLLLTQKLLTMLEEKPELLTALAGTLLELALKKKDLAAIKEITDRIEGKAIQRSEITGEDGEPLQGLVIIKNGDTTK